MTTQEKLETIRQACIKANPEKFKSFECEFCGQTHTIRLADVLLAIVQKPPQMTFQVAQGKGGAFLIMRNLDNNILDGLWNLRTDDLTQQSESTIDFLAELLQ